MYPSPSTTLTTGIYISTYENIFILQDENLSSPKEKEEFERT
jgi:hypothetical protein